MARHDVLDDAHLARLVVVHDGRVAEVVQREEQDDAAEQEPADARLAEKTSHHGSEHSTRLRHRVRTLPVVHGVIHVRSRCVLDRAAVRS